MKTVTYQNDVLENKRFFVEIMFANFNYKKIVVDYVSAKNMYRIGGSKNSWHTLEQLQHRLDNNEVVSSEELLLENRIVREGWDRTNKDVWSKDS